MVTKDRRVRQLENRILHWTNHLQDRRKSADERLAARLESEKSSKKAEHWRQKHASEHATADTLETERLLPLQTEYRKLLGLDD